jgi:hypothetical protein
MSSRQLPQRISAIAPIGSLLKRFDVPTTRPAPRGKDPSHLALVRQCPCLSCGLDIGCEPAHVRYASAAYGRSSGMARKPLDSDVVPLCADCHRLGRAAQHSGNEEAFWIRLGVDPLAVCRRLYAQRGDLVAMRSVIFTTTAARGLLK